jgi:hypothetical protein
MQIIMKVFEHQLALPQLAAKSFDPTLLCKVRP